jgi:quercetin dioxygenase-like cupin family protein
VTLPPATKMPRHNHGESDALLIPLAGELLLVGGDGCVERLTPGVLATVAAHERVSVENPTAEPANMLVCFAPATFVETLPAALAPALVGAPC